MKRLLNLGLTLVIGLTIVPMQAMERSATSSKTTNRPTYKFKSRYVREDNEDLTTFLRRLREGRASADTSDDNSNDGKTNSRKALSSNFSYYSGGSSTQRYSPSRTYSPSDDSSRSRYSSGTPTYDYPRLNPSNGSALARRTSATQYATRVYTDPSNFSGKEHRSLEHPRGNLSSSNKNTTQHFSDNTQTAAGAGGSSAEAQEQRPAQQASTTNTSTFTHSNALRASFALPAPQPTPQPSQAACTTNAAKAGEAQLLQSAIGNPQCMHIPAQPSSAGFAPQSREITIDEKLIKFLEKEAPRALKKAIFFLLNRDRASNKMVPQNIIFAGPPGTGKTLFAMLIAASCNLPCFFYEATALANTYKNSGNVNINKIFSDAIDLKTPCVIVIDELQILLNSFHNEHDTDKSMLSAFWEQVDLCKSHPISIVATMNHAKHAPQITSRFEVIDVKLPSVGLRTKILNLYMDIAEASSRTKFDGISTETLAQKTDGLSPRELNMLVWRSGREALFKKYEETGDADKVFNSTIQVTMADFLTTLEEIKNAPRAIEGTLNETWATTIKKWGKDSAPYLLNVALTGASLYLQYRMHQDNLKNSRVLHQDGQKHAQQLHYENLENGRSQQAFAQQDMNKREQAGREFSKTLHDDSHSVQRQVQQAVVSAGIGALLPSCSIM